MPNAYVVLDLEWNQGWAHGVQCSELLQIGAVALDDRFQITDTFNTYLRPVHLRRLNNTIMRLTGAKAEDVRQSETFDVVWPAFSAWCGDARLLAWGPSDERMLRHNLALYELDDTLQPFYNVQLAYSAAAGLTQEPSLSSAVESLGLDASLAYHDAANDARYTAEIARTLAQLDGGKLPDLASIRGKLTALVEAQQAEQREAVSAELTRLLSDTPTLDRRVLRGYATEQNCRSAPRARRMTCPQCDWSTAVSALYPYAPLQYLGRATCPLHGPLYLALSIRTGPSGRWGGIVRQIPQSEALDAAYRAARGCIPAANLLPPARRRRHAHTAV